MDYDNSALNDSYHIEAPDYAFNLHDDLEGTPSESVVHADSAHFEPAAFPDEENLEGTPSGFSVGHDSYAPFELSLDADLLCVPEDNLEGTPSKFSTGHISNAPTEPSLNDNLLSDAENDLEGTPSESSICHGSNASTDPPSDEDCDAASTCSSPASASLPDRATTPRSTAKFRIRYNYQWTAAHSSYAAHAAVLTRPNHPSGTPTGSVNQSLKPGNEHEGTPSCFEPRPPASSTSRPAEAAATQDFELQLKRLLCLLAKAKQDALIHVAAAETSSQLEQLMPLALANEIAWMDAGEWREQAEAIEDAWLTHLAALAEHDVAAYTTARQHYDRFCDDHGLYANLERAKELFAMLGDVVRQTDEQSRKLSALPPRKKNGAFSIVGTMPLVKLYKLPGTPGYSELTGSKSDKQGRGTPRASSSRPTPEDGIATARINRPPSAAPKASKRDQAAAPAQLRPYCVFCRNHDHWSSDCPTHDLTHTGGSSPINASCAASAFMQAINLPTAGSPTVAASTAQLTIMPLCAQSHIRVATAAGGCSPPGSGTTAHSVEAQRKHDDRYTTTNPLDTKPRPSSSTQQIKQSPAAADVEPSNDHRLASAITSFFQRNSTGTDVVVGFYARTQDDAGRTFYRILKPLPPSVQLPSAATDLYDHLQVDRVIMLETIAHVLPCDPLLPSTATPDADTRQTRRFTYPSAGSSYCVHPTTQGVAATDLSGVAPRQATVLSDLAPAMRTSPLPHSDALSPTTTDSAPGEVEPEDQSTASRRSRRKRGPRRKQSDHSRSTSSTQSTPIMTTGSPAALTATAGPRDPTHKPLAGSQTSGTPLDPLECDDGESVHSTTSPTSTPTISKRQLPLKGRRSWTESSRKAPIPEPSPSTTTTIMPHDTKALQAHARIEKTVVSELTASGNCQEQLFGCAKAHASSPRFEATKPVTVLFDSAVNHSTCSALLASDLQLTITSSGMDTSGSPSTLPFLTTQISVTFDGGPDLTIPVNLATMSVRTVHTAFVNKRDSLQLTSGSRRASPIQILPHIVIGRDCQHLFRETLSGWTAIEPSLGSTNASTTPPEAQPPSGLNGTPLKPDPGHTTASSTPSTVQPSSSLSGTPLEPDAGSPTDIPSRTHDADATSAPAQRSCALGGPSTFQEKSMGKQRKPVEDLKESWVPHDNVPPAAFSLQEIDDYSPHRASPKEHAILHQRRDSAASDLLDVTVVNTEHRVNLADSQPVIAMQSNTDADPHILMLRPVLSFQSSIAQDAGASAASASSGQSSAAATAAAAPAAAPETPGLAVHAAAAARVLKLDRERWGMHDQMLSSGDFAIHRWDDSFFVRRQPVWVTLLEARKLMMSELRQIVVSELRTLLHGQILYINTWTQRNHMRSPNDWQPHDAYRNNITRILGSHEGRLACVSILWFPTDEKLPDYFEAVRRMDLQLRWTISLQKPDGTPSGGGVNLFWTMPDDGFPGRSDDHGREQTRLNAAAILQSIQGPEVQHHRPHAPPDHGRTSKAVNAYPATEHEPMNLDAADAEGTPSVDAIPLPAHKPSRIRSSTAKPSGDNGIEKDGSPAAFSDFSDSPAPGTSFEPDMQLQINQQTLALLFPQAGPELIGKLRDDYQKLALTLPDAEAMGETTSVPGPMPRDALPAAAADEDTNLSNSTLTPMDANAPRAARNSSQPLDEPAPLNPDSGHLPVVIAAGSLSPSRQPVVTAYVSHNPRHGHPSVATAARGRSPSGRFADLPRNPGLGHPSVAAAGGGRSPPDTFTSDTIRTTTSSTEQRRGTLRASSRGQPETRRFDQPRLCEGRQGH